MSANHQDMEKVVGGLPSKSAKIRALAKAGFRRTEISKFMGVRYQFVRNVLVEEGRRAQDRAVEMISANSLERAPRPKSENATVRLRIDSEGRVALPRAIREALAVGEGHALIGSVEDGELRLLTIPAAVRRAQAIVRQYIPEGVSLVDDLLEDRRREAERETSE